MMSRPSKRTDPSMCADVGLMTFGMKAARIWVFSACVGRLDEGMWVGLACPGERAGGWFAGRLAGTGGVAGQPNGWVAAST
jgi:hypothetical protein